MYTAKRLNNTQAKQITHNCIHKYTAYPDPSHPEIITVMP